MKTCTDCHDLGYRTMRGKRWAEAEVCHCKRPCPDCGGEGRLIQRQENGRTYVVDCDCRMLEARVRHFNGAHLPAAYHDKTIESFAGELSPQQREVKTFLLSYQATCRPSARGVLMVGPCGVGKTHVLCGLLRYLILEQAQVCRYIDSFQLLEELRATFETGTGASALMSEVCSVPILGIDELGKTRTTGWQLEVLDQIVSRRYDEGLTTLLTSNYGFRREGGTRSDDAARLGEETLEDRVGPRIYSRLMEMCTTFQVNGPDRRLAAPR